MTSKKKRKADASSSELTVSAAGVTVKGELADDLRKPVKRVASTADSILRLANNVVSLPFDYLSRNLEAFRRRYSEKFDEIPADQRQQPAMRLACTALQQAALSADAPDIQAMFAQLLASASDVRLAAQVHPGFVSIIGELDANDALFLRSVAAATSYESTLHWAGLPEGFHKQTSASTANLFRLGIFETRERPYNAQELNRLIGTTHYDTPRDWNDGTRVLVTLINDVQRMKNDLVNKLRQQHERQGMYISSFGRSFIRVALGMELPTPDAVSTHITVQS